jgi:hypothetical protein
VLVETVVTAIVDQFPRTRRLRIVVLAAVVAVSLLLAIPYTCNVSVTLDMLTIITLKAIANVCSTGP